MKKLFLLMVSVVVLLLAACSGDEGSSEKNAESGENVELTIGMWDEAQAKAYEPVIEEFQKQNPNIKVTLQPTPWEQYWTKLDTAASSSVLPDVFWMNGPNFQKYASNGILLPLNDYIENGEIDLSNYPPELVDLYTLEDESYGIPKDFDTVGLFYNKELFDKAGVEYPDDTWDWTTLVETAKKLTDAENGTFGMVSFLNNQAGYYNTIYQAGGHILSEDQQDIGYDDAATIEGMKFWTDLIHESKVSPTLAQMTDTAPRQFFESGKAAMMYDGSWMASVFNEALPDKVGVAVLPEGKERATIIHGTSHAIATNTKHPDEAWKLVEFLGSEEASLMFSESGSFIPAFNGTQDAWVEKLPDMNLQAFIEMLDYAVAYPANDNTPEWQAMESEILPKAWTGEQSTEDTLNELDEEIEKILDK